MLISLTRDQETWVASHVAAGNFPSIEVAVQQLLDERIAELDLETDDLAWAKPHVDAARTDVAKGGFVTLEDHRAYMAQLLNKLGA